jgi:hypothetical protein
MPGITARVAATGAKKFTSKVWRKFTDVDEADAGVLGRIVDEQVDRALGGRHRVEGLS